MSSGGGGGGGGGGSGGNGGGESTLQQWETKQMLTFIVQPKLTHINRNMQNVTHWKQQ